MKSKKKKKKKEDNYHIKYSLTNAREQSIT
jgi:hypothetical protein